MGTMWVRCGPYVVHEARLRRQVVRSMVGGRGKVGRRAWRGAASSTRPLPCSRQAFVLSSLIVLFPARTIVCVLREFAQAREQGHLRQIAH